MEKRWYKGRFWGYGLGFILFYAPFAFFQKTVLIFMGKDYEPTIHNLCLRIPIEHILDGRVLGAIGLSTVSTLILLGLAFVFGPVFCGRLCPSGALGEYVSRLVPERFKISWGEYLPVTYLRYGMLLGFIITPLWGGLLACAYCNFFVFDLLANYLLWGYAVSFTSSLLLTLILYLIVFGLFTKGGRGFCTFFCPVGAIQNFLHYWGRKIPVTYKLQINPSKCTACKMCVRKCPMQALLWQDGKLIYNSHICILCGDCSQLCPGGAIKYESGRLK